MSWIIPAVQAAYGIYQGERADKRARSQGALAGQVGAAQYDRIAQGTRLRQEIENMIKSMADGGAPPAWRLGTRKGEGSDIEEYMSQLQSNAELNKLMELLGVGEGNVSTANQALSASMVGDEARRQQTSQWAQALLFSLGQMGGGGGGVYSAPSGGYGNGTSFGNGAVIGNPGG
jgi:hypothetical protein